MRIYKMMFLPHVKFIMSPMRSPHFHMKHSYCVQADFQTFFTRNSINDGIVVYMECFRNLNQSKVNFWFGPG